MCQEVYGAIDPEAHSSFRLAAVLAGRVVLTGLFKMVRMSSQGENGSMVRHACALVEAEIVAQYGIAVPDGVTLSPIWLT